MKNLLNHTVQRVCASEIFLAINSKFHEQEKLSVCLAIGKTAKRASFRIATMINLLICAAMINMFKAQPALHIRRGGGRSKKRLNILLINGKWDCAGVGISLGNAINRYTNHRARHLVREVNFLKYQTDIMPAHYSPLWLWPLLKVIEEADILHFNYVDHTVPFFDLKWPDFMHSKKIIFHDHSGWEPRKWLRNDYVNGTLFHKYDDYDRVIVCAPSDTLFLIRQYGYLILCLFIKQNIYRITGCPTAR